MSFKRNVQKEMKTTHRESIVPVTGRPELGCRSACGRNMAELCNTLILLLETYRDDRLLK